MKKFYLLLVALIASVAANAADYYLNGNFCGWKKWDTTELAEYKFTADSDGKLVLDLAQTSKSDLSGEFLAVAIGPSGADWSTKITRTGSNKVVEGVPYAYTLGGSNNLQVDGTIANAKVVIDLDAKTITVTGQAQENSFDTVYIIGDINGSGWNEMTTDYPLAAKGDDTYEGEITISAPSYVKPRCGNQILSASGSDLVPVMGDTYTLDQSDDKAVYLENPGTYTVTVVADQKAESCKITFTSDTPFYKEIVFYFDNTTAQWDEVTAIFTNEAGDENEYLMEETSEAGILEGYATEAYTKVKFVDGGSNETAEYDLKNSYLYSTTNSGEPYELPVDYSQWYVNVIGDFNDWLDNGVNPDENGVAELTDLEIGTSEFKVKVWDGTAEAWFSTGGAINLDEWITINGNNNVNMTVAGATETSKYIVKFNVKTNAIFISADSGVEAIAIDADNVAPVYYNLQGVQVNQPANGLYIVRRGDKVAKEIVR